MTDTTTSPLPSGPPTDEPGMGGMAAPDAGPGSTGGGDPMSAPVQVDYFAMANVTQNVMLPDGVTYITIQKLTEGARREYLNKTNSEMRLNRQTGDAFVKMMTGEERLALLGQAIVGWNFHRDTGRGMEPVPFNKGSKGCNLEQWLERADPAIVDLIEFEIRKMNPWLQGEMTVEQIDEEIKRLEEMRKTVVEREAGNVP